MHGELRFIPPVPDTVSRAPGAWEITATPDVMMRLKRIFPRAEKHRTAQITLIHTTEVARDLEWALQRWPLQITPTDWEMLRSAAEEHCQQEEQVLALLSGDRPHLDFPEPARAARDYQTIAADLAMTTRGLLLADELGLGKTMSALLTLRDPENLPALVVCPTHLPRQWQRELGATLPWLKAHIIRTGKPYDPAEHREMRGHDPDVLIINYHKIAGWVDHLAGRVRTVIFDEAQELRRAESQKYMAAARIADGASLRVGLSATPVFNYAGEIHNIMSVLAPDVLGSREEFAREWAAGSTWETRMPVGDPAALGTYLRGQGRMLRRTRADVGRELPDVVRVPHTVDADEKVHDALLEGTIDLAQVILSGGDRKAAFTAEGELDWRMRQATGVAKAPYVAEFVRMLLESERKVVLFGWHREVYSIWLERLADLQPVLYTGSESPAQKEQARTRFLEDEDSRILIMSLRSGSGLDGLQEASSVAVFGELDWSPGVHSQCVGRLHRDGQDRNVLAYFLVAEIGADPVIADVLNLKRMQSEPLTDPDHALFDTLGEDPRGRVRKLAEQVIAKRARPEAVAA